MQKSLCVGIIKQKHQLNQIIITQPTNPHYRKREQLQAWHKYFTRQRIHMADEIYTARNISQVR